MIDQDTLSVAEWLKSFGFEPYANTFSDHGLGLRCDFGNFELTASFVMGKYFQDVVLFLGVLSTPRTIAEVEFEMPRRGMSREKSAAWIVWHLDQAADNRVFVPSRKAEWLDMGRQNKCLLPWEIERIREEREMAAYNARPKCTIKREWMKLALRSLVEALASCSDEDEVSFDYDGRVLTIACGEKSVVVGAEGNRWKSSYLIAAGTLRTLPKRLMSPHVDLSVWDGRLHIDRWRYNGLKERPHYGEELDDHT